jgi:hypothetical protein
VRREPDRILALATRVVERPAWLEVLDLGDEEAVRLCRPQILGRGVAFVPVLRSYEVSPDPQRDRSLPV